MQPTTALKGSRLSLQQSYMWTYQKKDQVERVRGLFLLEGPLEVERVKGVLLRVMERETILRTVYRQVAGMQEPMQVVVPPEQVADLLDFRSEEGNFGEEEECRHLLEQDAQQGSDLTDGPMIRGWIRHMKQDRWVLLLSLPNLSADGATLMRLIQAISHEYSYNANSSDDEQEEPLPYAQVAAWQYDLLHGEEGQEGRAFWDRFDLEGVTDEPVPLANKRIGRVEQKQDVPWATQKHQIFLSREASDTIVRMAQKLRISEEAVVLACWQIVLWRLREQEEVLLGVACDGRSLDELAQALGSYTRSVPLQKQLFPGQSFERVVLQAHKALSEAIEEQMYFTWEGRTTPERPGFFPLGFAWDVWPTPWQEGGLRWQVLDLQAQQEPSILTLRGYQQGEQISLSLSCAPTFLQPDAPAQLASCLSTLLSAAVRAPQTRLGALPLLSQEHQAHQRQLGQGRGIPPIEWGGIAAAFEQQVARTPQLPALLVGEQTLSYAQLNARANQLAHRLRGLEVQPGYLVGLWATRSAGAVVALLAILKAGAGYVPLDPEQPMARLTVSLSILDSGLVLSDATVAVRLPGWDGRVLRWEEDEQVAQAPTVNPSRSTTLAEVAYVIFTSGSSGVPKGMRITQGNLLAYLQGWWQELRPEAGWHYGLVSTLAADLGNTQVYGALLSGGCLRIFAYEQLTDGQAMQEAVQQQPLDVLKLVPSHLQALLSSCTQPEALLPRVALVLGGERFPRQVLQHLRALGGVERLYNHYGPTETTIGALVHRIREETETEQEWHSVPVGRPLGHMRAIVVDPWGELVPWGIVGELWLGGAGVGEGYVGQAALTSERFVPGEGGARWYRTGDAVRWTREGQIEYVGRRDRQLKIRGQRIEPGEIEAVLCEQEGVREAVVELRTDEQGRARLVAYVVGKQQPWPTGEELRRGVGERLPAAMVPDAYVVLADWPLTRNGKIDRRALPEPGEEEGQRGQMGEGRQEWGSPVEELLASIWQEVLGIKQRVLRRDEHFFHLGGHSLLATQVMARVRVAFGVEIPILALFEAPTIAQLGQRVQEALRGQQGLPIAPPLVPVSREQLLPLSFAQQRLWFLNQLDPESSAYYKSVATWLHGPLSVQALEQSFTEVVRRHESLRTIFHLQDGYPVQCIRAATTVALPVIDLRGISVDRHEAIVQALLQEEGTYPFDLAQGPLLRACLFRAGEQKHAFLLTMHHIVFDGWSNGIMMRELSALYGAFATGKPSPLPELALQYADYAVWQRSWLQGETLEHYLAYWRQRLADIPPFLNIPTDWQRASIYNEHGALEYMHIAPSVLEDLREFCQENNATLFMALLCVLKIVLFRWTGEKDITVGTVVANRAQEKMEQLIGCFMNFLVLRSTIEDNMNGVELLNQVKMTTLGAFEYQDMPFEKLVEALKPDREQYHNPFYNVAFLLQNFLQETPVSGELHFGSLPSFRQGVLLDLRFIASEAPDGLLLACEYDTALFEAKTIQQLLALYSSTLELLVQEPTRKLASFTIEDELAAKGLAARQRDRKRTVAIAATFTAEPIQEVLDYWIQQLKLPLTLEFAPYNQIFQQLLDPSSLLMCNEQGVNIILLRVEDWLSTHIDQETEEVVEARVVQIVDEFVEALRLSIQRSSAAYLLCLCPASPFIVASPLWHKAIGYTEKRIIEQCVEIRGVHLVTGADLQASYPVTTSYNAFGDKVGHIPYTSQFFTASGTLLARKMFALYRSPYKVIVVDCDQTLWRGICGEDGPTGIVIDASRRLLQDFLVSQKEKGMLLCICSKNNEKDVKEVFSLRTEMPLKREHLVAWRVNWQSKSSNLYSLAQELGLSLESFIFIDDDPLECAEVKAQCPDIFVVPLSQDIEDMESFLQHLWIFDQLNITEEDKKRTQLYQQQGHRERFQQSVSTMKDFIDGLSLEISIVPYSEQQVKRIVQLTQRTNQFNSTTVRYTETQFLQFCATEGECLIVEVSDRFGDYGLVGVILFTIRAKELIVDTFLLSCRALGRGVEYKMLAQLGEIAYRRGALRVLVPFIPTAKNAPARKFLDSCSGVVKQLSDKDEQIYTFSVEMAKQLSYRDTDEQLKHAEDTREAEGISEQKVNKEQAVASIQINREFLLHIAHKLCSTDQILRTLSAQKRHRVESDRPLISPRTKIEEELAEIWTEVLHLEQVGVHDNFFDMGGHSLLATQLLSRVSRVFLIELPLQSIFDAPTLATFALHVEQALQNNDFKASPVITVTRKEHLPLSFAQQRLWFLAQLEPENVAYNMPYAVSLQGALSVAVLEQCLSEMVRRHESLRTVFRLQGEEPVQCILPAQTFHLPLIDLHDRSPEQKEELIRRLVGQEAGRPFDLAQGPLLRAMLLRLGEEEHAFLLTMHHIVSDAWSNRIILQELSVLYQAFAAGNASPLPDLTIQYADYALWQRSWLQGALLEHHLHYWQERLAYLPALELPTDHPRPAVLSTRGERVSFTLPATLTPALSALAREEGVTLFMLLLAGVQAVLGRWSGQERFAIGTPIANRSHLESEALIGFFVNTLVLRADLAGNLTFRQLLRRVREEALGAYAHQEVPFEALVEKVQPERDLSRSPLFQVLFQLQTQGERTAMQELVPGLGLRPLGVESPTAKFDLTWSLREGEQGWHGVLEYHTDLFTATTAQRFVQHFEQLVQDAIAHPDRPLTRLRLLSATEEEFLLEHWNATTSFLPEQEDLVSQRFARQVALRPDALAISFAEQEEALSYAGLERLVRQIGARLRSAGVQAGALVGVALERSPLLVGSLLAILGEGAAYVPLDPSYPAERLAYMLADSGASVVVTQQEVQQRGAIWLGESRVLVLPTQAEVWREEPVIPQERGPVVSGEQVAYVIYTSGSTGRPKGTVIGQRALSNFLGSMQRAPGMQAGERIAALTAYSFDIAVVELIEPITVGASVALASREVARNGQELRAWMSRVGPDLVQGTPTLWRLLLEADWEGAPGMRVLCGGEMLRADLVQKLITRSREVWNGYGPTEATIYATMKQISGQEERIVVGRGIANTQVYVLDAAGELVPWGRIGEVYLGGAGLAQGYLGNREQTAARFVPDGYGKQAGGRLYRTGDLGRWTQAGDLEIVGRADQQIKLRGYRIELGEIETVLRGVAGVREVVVVLWEERLVAYLVRAEQEEGPTNQQVRAWVRERLPEYMQPSQLVWMDAVPVTANGKLDRRALPAPSVEQERGAQREEHEEDPLEGLVQQIWESVLHREGIGRRENFFELGGHSLLATQVMARIRSRLQVEVPLRSLFEAPTIAGLGQRVQKALREQQGLAVAPPLVPIAREQTLPLSFAQQRLWFLGQLEPENVAYNMPYAVSLQGALSVAVLEQCLSEMIRRHESLRTVFRLQDEEPVQCILPAQTFHLPLIDLHDRSPEQKEELIRRLVGQEAGRPFDLAQGPLLRVMLLRLGEEEHVFLLTMHHIVSDAWSNEIFLRELSVLYQAFAAGNASPLPDLTIQYADYALWQRGWLQGALLEHHLYYWQERLADLPALELPTDHPRPAVLSTRGERVSHLLPPELMGALNQLAREEGVTLFMVLLAGVQAVLGRWSGQERFAIGTPVANRSHLESEALIGFFVNTLVLRADLAGSPTFRQLLRRVREEALGAYAHQEVPFEALVEKVQPERDLSRAPLFQVLFQLQTQGERTAMQELVPGLGLRPLGVESSTAKYDLMWSLREGEQGWHGVLEYHTDLFTATTAQRFVQHFEQLVQDAVAHPDRPLARLRLLSATEEEFLLTHWNATAFPLPEQEDLVPQRFARQVALRPDALAISFAEQEEALSYAGLERLVRQIRARLRSAGVQAGALVGVALERSPLLVGSLLAILGEGAAYVPLDPSYPAERLAYMLADSGASVVVTQQQVQQRGAPWLGESRVLVLPTQAEVWREEPVIPQERGPVVSGEQVAYVIYTSGSTGRPKGTVIGQRALSNFLGSMQREPGMQAGERIGALTAYSFDIAVVELIEPITVGASVVLASREVASNGQELRAWMSRVGPDLVQGTPTLWRLLLEAGWEGATEMRVWCGGEALRADVAQELVARSREVWNMYGPTETTVWSTTRRISGQEERIVVGRGIANTQVYVLDAAGELVPWGRIGEVYLGGAGLAQGYLGNREQTAARFVPDGYGKQAGGRLYRTGDLGRWTQAGDLEIVGRADQQVKLRGYRIELGEIETVLRGVAGVREAVVVLWEERLVAYLVRAEQEEGPTNQQVRAWVRERLPEYMQPSQLVWIDALPVTANGKLDRRALPAPSVEQERGAQREEHEEDPLEGLVQQIWESVLHREGIGRRENFFELGGHSLLATQVMARVRSRLQVELPLRSLFEAPTIAGLGHQVQKALREQQGLAVAPPLVPVAREHRLPLSFAQQRLWFLDQLFPDRAQAASYLICLAVQFQGALSIEALERSLSALMARHESLRTMLVSEQGEPWQEIKATGRPELLVVDLTGLAQEVREEQSRRLLQEEQTVPCSLREGPLWRTRVLRQGGQEHLLVMTLHHSIVDGWSLSVLQRELVAFYRAEVRGEEARLLRLPIQYGDYALWQRTWLQGEVLEEHVRYWRERLRGARGFQAPVDHPRSGQGSGRGGSVGVMFSAEVSAQIKEGARQERVTVFMFLLAAFQVLLSRWSGQEDIVVGTDIANRTREETEGLIGFFVNLLALRTSFTSKSTFRKVLGQVRESVLGAYMHQDIPFEKLIESLKLERETHQTPLVHVLFVLQNVPEEPLEALEGISAQVVRSETTSAKFELALFLQEGPRGLQGRIVYNKDLFEQATIERLSKWFQTMVEQLVVSPDVVLAQVEYRSPEEQHEQAKREQGRLSKQRQRLLAASDQGIELESPME